MEQLLLVLFLLFSVFSALMERRKRRRQKEEAEQQKQRQQEQGEPKSAAPAAADEEEEEEWGDWPFPSGDPFERQQPQSVERQPEAMPPATDEAQMLVEQLEQQAQAAEAPARRTTASERQQQLRSVSASQRVRQVRKSPADTARKGSGGGRYRVTAKTARDAVVYAELFGPCKAEQEEEWRW